MSQADLARACKVTTAQISRIVSGDRGGGKKTLIAIAQAFHLPPELVFEKAGLLPAKSELSPIKRALLHLAKDLPDSDIEMVVAQLEQRTEYYKKNPQARPSK